MVILRTFISILILYATFSLIHILKEEIFLNFLNRKTDKDLFDFVTD